MMKASTGPYDMAELLSGFLDRELDGSQTLAVLDYIQTHPEAVEYLRTQERIRQHSRRIILADEQANMVPAALKNRLMEIAAATPGDGSSSPSLKVISPENHIAYSWPRILAAIAASITVGLVFGLYLNRTHETVVELPTTRPNQIAKSPDAEGDTIPVSFERAAIHVHVDCSRVAENLHSGGYPVQLGPLSNLVRSDLKSSAPEPDLSSIGYHFVGAGPCAHPLEGTVHLLYRKNGPEPRAAVSIFVQANHGQYRLEIGRWYRISSRTAAFPMYAWRTKEVVYFLVADDMSTADAALRAIPFDATRTGT